MSWYRVIKLAASPKNIVNQWKVDDPFLKFFIYTYEPLIDLNKIKNKEDLNEFIKGDLIPSLKSKIDINNRDGYYKKSMTNEEALAEVDEHEADPRIQSAIRKFKENPEAAKVILLRAINEDKKLSFDKWWSYMSNEIDHSPAFFYSMVNPMIESSPAGQKNGPPPASRKAISLIKDEIGSKGVTQMNVFKKFIKNSFKIDKESSESIDIDDKKSWIRIDSMQRDPKNYQDNQEKLMRFATDSGWCIAQNQHSNDYLRKGDFWLYFENKRPKAAIRLQGDKNVQEIRGLYNKEKTLDPYWEPVTSFLHNTDFNYQDQSHYKRLQDIMMKNAHLDDPAVFQNLLKAIEADPKQLGLVSDENRQKFPEQVQQLTIAAAKGYDKRMNVLLDSIEQISVSGNEYQQRFGRFQDEFGDIPEDVRPHMSSDIQGRLVAVHKNAFMRNPLEYEFFPDDMKAIITPEEQTQAWTNYVGQDPYRYNDLRIPMEVRKYIPLRPIVEGWDRLVNQNIDHADNIPKFILKYLPENYVENKIVADFKKYPCNRTSKGYDKLQRVQEKGLLDENQILQTYTDFVSKNAHNSAMQNPLMFVPPQYRDLITNTMEDMSPIADRYFKQVLQDATYFASIPDDNIRNILLTDPRYSQGVLMSFERMQQKYSGDWNGYWMDIPNEVKPLMSDNIKNSVANFWLPYVQNNNSLLGQLDNVIKPLVENRLQAPPTTEASGNWYKKKVSYELV